MSCLIKDLARALRDNKFIEMDASTFECVCDIIESIPSAEPSVGYVGVDDDYLVSVKEVLNITAETGALETQRRVRELPRRDRTQGEWIEHRPPTNDYCGMVECPFCGEELVGEPTDFNYCPNCGADMRGEDDGR